MRIALLTNFVAPYRIPLLKALRDQCGDLRVLASTGMERNRQWHVDWDDLDVVVQRTITLRRMWKHQTFVEPYELHIPYDTIPQLYRYKPHVVITGEFGLRTAQAIAYSKTAATPVIIWATLTEHLEQGRNRARQLTRKLMVRAADRIIVNGESGARYIRSCGASPESIATIPQTTDLSPFLALPASRSAESARRLLFVGMISHRKSSDLLIEALRRRAVQTPQQQLSITIVGEGPLRAKLQAVPLPRNVEVEWAGAVPYADLPRWYARSGLLIFPTQGDEWGLVVNEALAAGLPVIGSEYSQAVDELVKDGENGWRFRPDNPDSIGAAIDRALLTADETLDTMRTNARAAVRDLTPGNIAAAFIAAVAR